MSNLDTLDTPPRLFWLTRPGDSSAGHSKSRWLLPFHPFQNAHVFVESHRNSVFVIQAAVVFAKVESWWTACDTSKPWFLKQTPSEQCWICWFLQNPLFRKRQKLETYMFFALPFVHKWCLSAVLQPCPKNASETVILRINGNLGRGMWAEFSQNSAC